MISASTVHGEPAHGLRRVAVESLSARAELLLVARVALALVVGVWVYVAIAAGVGGGSSSQKHLLPFQQVIADRPDLEQRTFRELQEGLLEAEASRSADGSWPAVEKLAADGVPPFAADPTRRERYTWSFTQSGTVVNYCGVPSDATAPAWLVLVQEPDPGIPPDQSFEDEEHHRLSTGSMLHVSTWTHANGAALSPHIVRMPQAEGWMQLYAVGPAASAASSGPASAAPALAAPASPAPAAPPTPGALPAR